MIKQKLILLFSPVLLHAQGIQRVGELFVSLKTHPMSVRNELKMVLLFSMIGAARGMLLFHKPGFIPGLLVILLLFGIIIKNAVLLIDLYQKHRTSGESPYNSAVESVLVRFRTV